MNVWIVMSSGGEYADYEEAIVSVHSSLKGAENVLDLVAAVRQRREDWVCPNCKRGSKSAYDFDTKMTCAVHKQNYPFYGQWEEHDYWIVKHKVKTSDQGAGDD